ncbi:MAG: preprotein translocase subunit SecY [Candidatus Diapherotrites archaeon]|nr:preprotein translocase subunit SecY [Candidatus Diapherotrites archaeon]
MSFLDAFEPVYRLMPSVKAPAQTVGLQQRLLITLGVLILFYVMGTIPVIGLSAASAGALQQLQVVLASEMGTIISAGIGPIVLASIILQLLVGGGLIPIDLTNPSERLRFMSFQKLFAIALCFFEAAAYAQIGFLKPAEGMLLAVIAQVALGSILLLYLDEVTSKWGIGSGISLFIAAGVAQNVLWIAFNPFAAGKQFAGFGGQGLIFLFFQNLGSNILTTLNIYLLPILFTIVVFFVAVFAEGIHANIPVATARKGIGGRYPVKFLYVSNIPVILASALFANVVLWASLTKSIPFLGVALQKLGEVVRPPYTFREDLLTNLITVPFPEFLKQTGADLVQSITQFSGVGFGGTILHAILFILILVAICIVFGKFWVEMAGQGPSAVAGQLQKSGMHIPGYRSDPRVIQKVLERYIPPVAILGSIFVGLLAGFADLTGAIGSGTGILLTVGIVYRIYEELVKAQFVQANPILGKLLG